MNKGTIKTLEATINNYNEIMTKTMYTYFSRHIRIRK